MNLVLAALQRDKKLLIDFLGDAKDVKVKTNSQICNDEIFRLGCEIRRSRIVDRSAFDRN